MMSHGDGKHMEKLQEAEDPLFGSNVTPIEKKRSKCLCCTCTRKQLIVLLIIFAMLLIYIIGIAIGIAVGLGNKTDDEDESSNARSQTLIPVGAVVSDHKACSDIGRDILTRHGTAVDAAIATLVCCGVRAPQSMGIGGGNFMLIYDKSPQEAIFVDGREMAPHLLNDATYNDLKQQGVIGAVKIGIPGELKAYKHAHDKYGRLPWAELFAPTIKMLRDGYPLSKATATSLVFIQRYYQITNLTAMPSLCNIFCSDKEAGLVLKAGETHHWPHLADTLQGIADQGPNYIYDSDITQTLVNEIQDEGGVMDLRDFVMNYKVLSGSPLSVDLGNYTVYTMPGASGGPLLVLTLNILKRLFYMLPDLDMSDLGRRADIYHYLIEAMKFALADNIKLEDPEFSNAAKELIGNMTSEEYADIVRSRITDVTHEKRYYTDTSQRFHEHEGTSHVSVLSPYGDAVSVTSTVNYSFGSKLVSNTTGIIWNNEMDDFSSTGPKNVVQPLKRPRSAMVPVIVVDNEGSVRLVTGGAGGSRITASVAQVVAKLLLLDVPLKEAVDDKRFSPTLEQKMSTEKGFPEDLREELRKRGHILEDDARFPVYSIVESIMVEAGEIMGYADPRKEQAGTSYVTEAV